MSQLIIKGWWSCGKRDLVREVWSLISGSLIFHWGNRSSLRRDPFFQPGQDFKYQKLIFYRLSFKYTIELIRWVRCGLALSLEKMPVYLFLSCYRTRLNQIFPAHTGWFQLIYAYFGFKSATDASWSHLIWLDGVLFFTNLFFWGRPSIGVSFRFFPSAIFTHRWPTPNL